VIRVGSDSWGIDQIFANKILTGALEASSVRVALIDTGLSSLAGFKTTSYQRENIDPNATSLNTEDDLIRKDGFGGHGTAVASLIVQNESSIPQIGVARGVQILPIKSCNKKGDCKDESLIDGLCYAASDDGTGKPRADIINLSLGGYVNSAILLGALKDIEKVHEKGKKAGIIVVSAAGNTRRGPRVPQGKFCDSSNLDLKDPTKHHYDYDYILYNCEHYPAFYSDQVSNLVSVGSISEHGSQRLEGRSVKCDINYRYSSFSTANSHVDIIAPGGQVLTQRIEISGSTPKIASLKPTTIVVNRCSKFSAGPTFYATGTSFSTGYVSGALAAMIAARQSTSNPPLSPSELKQRLKTHSGCEDDPTYPNSCNGKGILDVQASINAALAP
jgi:subtilisin family serine protease